MLCDECKQNEAVVTISVMMDEEVQVRHLCPACNERLNRQIRSGGLHALLSSLLSAISDQKSADKKEVGFDLPEELQDKAPKQPEPVCACCHTTLSSFIRTGKLGCPGCYSAFRQQLQPMLMQIHGHVTHAGRTPLTTREAQQHRKRQEELTRQMAQAVAQEDFETAARLRDQLRALSEEEGKA